MFFEYFVEKYLDMDISFEDKFCKHFVTLRKCFEVFVSFNIDHYLSKRTDKITIPLFYNENLDVEEEKRYFDQFVKSVNLANVVGKSLVKSRLIFWIFTMAVYFLTEILHM